MNRSKAIIQIEVNCIYIAVPEVEEHERVICEYMAEKRQRLEDLDNTFGTTVLPTLERVLYKVRKKKFKTNTQI